MVKEYHIIGYFMIIKLKSGFGILKPTLLDGT